MEPKTHLKTDSHLCGHVLAVGEGSAQVGWLAEPEMAVDDRGLIHGGFVFGVADYAAMLAVNDPNVVLGASDCRFLAPVEVGDSLEARAIVLEEDGKKRLVKVDVVRGEALVLSGTFTCFVLARHVLDRQDGTGTGEAGKAGGRS